jgi:hypothetical protein
VEVVPWGSDKDFDFLEAIHDATNYPDEFISGIGLLQNYIADDETLMLWLERMIGDGFLELWDSTVFNVSLTLKGQAVVEDGRSKSSNLRLFREVVRIRLLLWSYNNSTVTSPEAEVVLSPEESWFYGRIITFEDLVLAAEELERKHLITKTALSSASAALALLVRINTEGQECVDYFDCDIKLYLQSRTPSLTKSGPMINIGSMNGGSFSVGG